MEAGDQKSKRYQSVVSMLGKVPLTINDSETIRSSLHAILKHEAKHHHS